MNLSFNRNLPERSSAGGCRHRLLRSPRRLLRLRRSSEEPNLQPVGEPLPHRVRDHARGRLEHRALLRRQIPDRRHDLVETLAVLLPVLPAGSFERPVRRSLRGLELLPHPRHERRHLRVIRPRRVPRRERAEEQPRDRLRFEEGVAGENHGGVATERPLRQVGEGDGEQLLLAGELGGRGVEHLRRGHEARRRGAAGPGRHQHRPWDVLRLWQLWELKREKTGEPRRLRELREKPAASFPRSLPEQDIRGAHGFLLQHLAQRLGAMGEEVPQAGGEGDGILRDRVEVDEDALARVSRHDAHRAVEHHRQPATLQDAAAAGGGRVQHLLQGSLRRGPVLAEELTRDERVRLHHQTVVGVADERDALERHHRPAEEGEVGRDRERDVVQDGEKVLGHRLESARGGLQRAVLHVVHPLQLGFVLFGAAALYVRRQSLVHERDDLGPVAVVG
mmetsp:Transcript_10006/g.41215  ORF Transcript_10006/g.41215 Transcript_10006/m.41215 type:complete len:449 (-) Transcript_10006:1415-2761(-)